jgi:hypothetical protein
MQLTKPGARRDNPASMPDDDLTTLLAALVAVDSVNPSLVRGSTSSLMERMRKAMAAAYAGMHGAVPGYHGPPGKGVDHGPAAPVHRAPARRSRDRRSRP